VAEGGDGGGDVEAGVGEALDGPAAGRLAAEADHGHLVELVLDDVEGPPAQQHPVAVGQGLGAQVDPTDGVPGPSLITRPRPVTRSAR